MGPGQKFGCHKASVQLRHADSMEHGSLAWSLPRGPWDAASHLPHSPHVGECWTLASENSRDCQWDLHSQVTELPHLRHHGQQGRRLLSGSLDRTQLLWLFYKHCPVSTFMGSHTVVSAPFLYLGVGSRHHWFATVPFQPQTTDLALPSLPFQSVSLSLQMCQNRLSTQLNTHKTSDLMIPCLFLLQSTFAIVSHRNVSFGFSIYSLRIWQVRTQLF